MCALKGQQAQGIVMGVVHMVVEKRGLKTLKELISEEALQSDLVISVHLITRKHGMLK